MRRRRCCWCANRKGAAPEGLALAGQAAGAKAPSFAGEPWVPLAQTGLQRCCPGNGSILAKRIGCQASRRRSKPSLRSLAQPNASRSKANPGGHRSGPPASGWTPTDLGPGPAWRAGSGDYYPRRALGLGPGQAPRPSSARALAWFSVPGNPANRSGDPPWEATKAPKPDRQPGHNRETTAKAPPDPWEPVGLAVPGWRAAAKGPAGPSHQAAWASGQTNPPGEPQLWRLLVWM